MSTITADQIALARPTADTVQGRFWEANFVALRGGSWACPTLTRPPDSRWPTARGMGRPTMDGAQQGRTGRGPSPPARSTARMGVAPRI
jgi:hypothetical protein